MKRLLLLMMTMLLCSSCTALPAEERAFAVALCVEREGAVWRVHGRIPTYKTGGDYLTVSGEGGTLSAALADMDTSAPMHVNLSQLRLLIISDALAESGGLREVLSELAGRVDLRADCAIAIADAPAKDVADALKPAAGARLSKAIDVMLDTRIEQGAIMSAAFADVLRMGERQSPVLIALTLENGAVSLSGGYPLTADMSLATRLTPAETALLSLLLGDAQALRLTFSDGSAQVREASAKVTLSEDRRTASVTLSLRATASTFSAEALEQTIAGELVTLMTRLSAEGCDVLGLGRQAILRMQDMAQWHALRWPEQLPGIAWRTSVQVTNVT